MIVRIKFKATVKSHSEYDEVDMHVKSESDAKKIFLYWVDKGFSIRGRSGVFHVQDFNGVYGKIKFKSAKEIKK